MQHFLVSLERQPRHFCRGQTPKCNFFFLFLVPDDSTGKLTSISNQQKSELAATLRTDNSGHRSSASAATASEAFCNVKVHRESLQASGQMLHLHDRTVSREIKKIYIHDNNVPLYPIDPAHGLMGTESV